MKVLTIFLLLFFWPLISDGQSRFRLDPKPGYEDRLRGFIDSMKIVDTHEHLLDPGKIKRSTVCDFMLLFHHFADDDIISSGMPEVKFYRLLSDSMTVKEKWAALKPYYENSFNTGFNRVATLAASRLFNIENINEYTVGTLSERIREAYQRNWFAEVIKDKCRIEFIIQDVEDRSFHLEGIRYLNRFDKYLCIKTKKDFEIPKKPGDKEVDTLDEYVKLLKSNFAQSLNGDVVGVKSQLAYTRSLNFENVKKDKAKKIFQRIINNSGNDTISSADIKAFQDYMMFRLLETVRDHQLPIQIHTGLQAGNVNSIQNSNPLLLTSLIREFPTVKFVLLHGGYPYGGELATLAKNCPNVYIDLSWLYAISPTYSKRYLAEWIETIPANKIMAFGGDYHNVENVYAELLIAKKVVSDVLIEKVTEGYFSEEEAKKLATMIFYKNAIDLYKLKRHGMGQDGIYLSTAYLPNPRWLNEN